MTKRAEKGWRKILRFRSIMVFLTVLALLSLILAYLSPYVHPKAVPFIPVFGLSYWIIAPINILLMLYWAIARSRWSLIVLGCLLLGGKLHFRTLCMGWDQENTKNTTELAVMSFNVRLFDLYNPSPKEARTNRDRIFSTLKEANADVYCIQEFYHQEPPTPFVTKDSLVPLLKTPFVHARASIRDGKRQEFGIIILSKHKIVQQGEVSFSDINPTNNYCIYADIVKQKDTFRVYNVHLQSIRLQQDDYALFSDQQPAGEEESQVKKLASKIVRAYPVRAEQARKVAAHMQTSPHPVIVCGDFNDTPMSYCYNQFGSWLVDAYRNTSRGIGVTYAGKIPAGRIDYIFHDSRLGSRNFTICREKLSDHYAIGCTIFPLTH